MKNVQRICIFTLCGAILFFNLIVCVDAESRTPDIGTVFTGKIVQGGQVNTYMAPSEANESFYIKAVTTSGKLWPRIKVYSPTGSEINSTGDISKAETVVILPTRGTFSILIDDATSWSQTGNYSIYIQSLTNPVNSNPLSVGSTMSGNINLPGKTDTYVYSGRSGETLILKATRTSGEMWPRITIFSPSGKQLLKKGGISVTELKYNISTTGQYVILIDDETPWNKLGEYTLFSQVFSQDGRSNSVSAPNNEAYTLPGKGNTQTNQSGNQPIPFEIILGAIVVLFVLIAGGIALYMRKRQQTASKVIRETSGYSKKVPSSQEGMVSGTVNHEIIISYSSQDKPIADAVCAGLEARLIRCWVAPRDILPGVNYQESIIDAIDSSSIMVLIFSSHSNNSPHVLTEVNEAMSKGIIIIPFRIEDILPSKAMKYLISGPHWLDAMTPPLEKHIDELGNTIRILLDNERKKRKTE